MSESTDCRVDRLSDYVDGGLDAPDAQVMERHLQACSSCWLVAEELKAVVEAAQALTDTEPEVDLWPGILEGISQATVIELPTGDQQHAPRPRGVFVSTGQLAMAATTVLLLIGGTWIARAPGITSTEQPVAELPSGGLSAQFAVSEDVGFNQVNSQIEELELVLAEARSGLDPNTVRILEKNLALIDQAIRESIDALAMEPDNSFVEDYLRRSYERKIDYLRGATELVALADE